MPQEGSRDLEEEPDEHIQRMSPTVSSSATWRSSMVVVAVGSEPDPTTPAFRHKMVRAGMKQGCRGFHSLPELSDSTSTSLASVNNYYVSISNPQDGSVRSRPMGLKQLCYDLVHGFPFQVVCALLFATSMTMILVQCFGSTRGNTYWFTFFTMLIYGMEIAILLAYESMNRLSRRERYWRLVEPFVITFALLLEIVAWSRYRRKGHGLVLLAWVRLLFWAVHGKTRYEELQFGIRALCSADRRRYRAEGFDLDLSYIHRNVAAMAWPATNFERFFRNSVEDVVEFLDRKHLKSYLVVNLCSERTYSPELFNHQASWYPMDDHNPAELHMILAFCREAVDFTTGDPNTRLVCVHCKGGKGRTGAVISAYLMYVGLKRTADAALTHFAHLRTKPGASNFQGVQTPSQDRYVRYFEKLLRIPDMKIPFRPVRVRRLVLHNIPWLWYSNGVGKLWFVILTKPCTQRNLVYKSNESVTFNPQVPDPSTYTSKQLRDLFGSDEDNLFKECNKMDSIDSRGHGENGGPHYYQIDTTSFWFYVDHNYDRKLSYGEFLSYLAAEQTSHAGLTPRFPVDLEFKELEDIPEVEGDVVFKFFFARNNPNPLEPPVQFWIHTAFEESRKIHLSRALLDGPPKDTKCERYPVDFSITLELEESATKVPLQREGID